MRNPSSHRMMGPLSFFHTIQNGRHLIQSSESDKTKHGKMGSKENNVLCVVERLGKSINIGFMIYEGWKIIQ